jgi:hypothetical protein
VTGLVLALLACGTPEPGLRSKNGTTSVPEPGPSTEPTSAPDLDGDGFSPPDDCDDRNPAAFPGAPDTWYDGVDSNCDAANDYDADGDGDSAPAFNGGGDCNDDDPSRSSEAVRVCGNGVDDDCDFLPDCDQRGEFLAEDLAAGVFTGTPGSDAGYWLDAGDVDGDGAVDLVVAGAEANLAFLFKGPLVGQIRDGADADAQLPGGAAGATMADFDGDGLADIAATTVGLFTQATTRIWIAGQFDPLAPAAQLVHEPGDGHPHRVEGADLNGDGIDDLVLGGLWGCPVTGWQVPGCAEIFYGPLEGVFDDTAVGSMVIAELDGALVSTPGQYGVEGRADVTGDGLPDLAIIDSFPVFGKAYVVEGPLLPEVWLDDAAVTFVPEDSTTGALATGDVDGDGAAELVVASTGIAGGWGAAWIFPGPLTPGELDPAQAMATVADVNATEDALGVFDFNADGSADLAIGSYDADHAPNDDAVFSIGVYYRPRGAVGADFILHDQAWGPRMVGTPGDVDGDGVEDLFAGSPGIRDTTGENAGGAYLILGVAAGY